MTITKSLLRLGDEVGRNYAGILGSLGMILVIARGLGNDGGVQETLGSGILTMAGLAVVGYVLGELAAWIVEDSVRTKIANEVTAAEAQRANGKS